MINFDYDKSEKIDGYIYFYKNKKIIAVYNPFTGLFIDKNYKNIKKNKENYYEVYYKKGKIL